MGRSSWSKIPYDNGDFDAAGEIGRGPAQVPIKLMRSGLVDGEMRFIEEVPALFRIDRCHETFARGKGNTHPETHSWYRLVIQVPGGATGGVVQSNKNHRDYLMLSYTPISAAWACSAPFRGPNRDGRGVFATTGFESASEFVKAIEALPFDYFETGKYLTAGVSYPDQPFLNDTQHRRADAWMTYGLCAEPREAESSLYQSSAAQELLEQTRTGSIRVVGPGAPSGEVKLFEEVIDAAETLMLCSIRQALAGPDDADQAQWLGKPVMVLVDRIYRNHLNNANRREATDYHNQMDYLDRVQRLYDEYMRNRGPEAGGTDAD